MNWLPGKRVGLKEKVNIEKNMAGFAGLYVRRGEQDDASSTEALDVAAGRPLQRGLP